MIRWLWKSGKQEAKEGSLSTRLAAVEATLRRLEEDQAARELTVARTLEQLRRLAGQITKTHALDNGAPKPETPLTADDVFALAKRQGVTR